jgi:uncharacterized protein (TIGR02145 family)
MKKGFLIVLSIVFVFSCKKASEEKPVGPPVKTTLGGRPGEGVTDIDQNKYPTVVFTNGQEWMAENLRTTRFNTGNPIPQIQSSNQWSAATDPAFSRSHKLGFRYPLNFYYDTLYGPKYNYQAAIDPKGLCPTGWRVPTDEDWKKLEKQLGMSDQLLNNTGWRGEASMNLADKIMAVSDKYNYLPIWEGIGGTNSSGFNAMSAGWIGQDGLYNAEFSQTYYWSQSDASSEDKGWARGLDAGQIGIERNVATLNHGYSIRCIKGEGSRATMNDIKATSDVEWTRVHPSYYSIGLTTSLLNDGKSPLTEVGFYWGTNPTPTSKDSSRIVTAVNGKYDITIKNLQPDKQYFFRAYAKNAFGISYTKTVNFYTGPYSSMQDQDNNVYKIKKIGNQVWMCENLKTTKRADGSPLLIATDRDTWNNNYGANFVGFKIASPQGDEIWYNFPTTKNANLCPAGWHVPAIEEFDNLVATIGGANSANVLKTTGTSDWAAPNSDATNSSGFSAKGKGYIDVIGNNIESFSRANFWSTTTYDIDSESGGGVSVFTIKNNPSSSFTRAETFRELGASVRCVKN